MTRRRPLPHCQQQQADENPRAGQQQDPTNEGNQNEGGYEQQWSPSHLLKLDQEDEVTYRSLLTK